MTSKKSKSPVASSSKDFFDLSDDEDMMLPTLMGDYDETCNIDYLKRVDDEVDDEMEELMKPPALIPSTSKKHLSFEEVKFHFPDSLAHFFTLLFSLKRNRICHL